MCYLQALFCFLFLRVTKVKKKRCMRCFKELSDILGNPLHSCRESEERINVALGSASNGYESVNQYSHLTPGNEVKMCLSFM